MPKRLPEIKFLSGENTLDVSIGKDSLASSWGPGPAGEWMVRLAGQTEVRVLADRQAAFNELLKLAEEATRTGATPAVTA